jgi:hypothetical protein
MTPALPPSSYKWPTESKIQFYLLFHGFVSPHYQQGARMRERVARTHSQLSLPTASTDIKGRYHVHSPAVTFAHPLFICQQGAPTHIITTSSHYAAVCAAVVVHQHDGVSGAIRCYPIVTRLINPHYPHSTP